MVSLPSGAEPVSDLDLFELLEPHEECELATDVAKPAAQPTPDVAPKKASSKSPRRGAHLSELAVTLADFGHQNWQYPVTPNRTVGSGYGRRESPIFKGRRVFHGGHDIACRTGERIYAAGDGDVVISQYSSTAGNFVVIRHHSDDDSLLETRYLHLSRRHVRRGKTVKAGDLIGRCGNTGRSTSPHLHFEVKRDGRTMAPLRNRQKSERFLFSDQLIGAPNDVLFQQCANGSGSTTTEPVEFSGEKSRL